MDVQDSDASGSDASQKLIGPVYSVNSGNTVDWFRIFSGTVYSDEGLTPVGAGYTIRLLVNGVDMNTYGSRGQQRTITLSLKLAEVEWITQQKNDKDTGNRYYWLPN